jgi:HSP20 family protein
MFKTSTSRFCLFLIVWLVTAGTCSSYLLNGFPQLMVKAKPLPASVLYSIKSNPRGDSPTSESKQLSGFLNDLVLSPSLFPFSDPFDFPLGRYRQNMPQILRKFREDLSTTGAMPAINLDVSESQTEWHVKADLPGMKKENITVAFDDGVLEITAERKYSRQSSDATEKEKPQGKAKSSEEDDEDYHKYHFSEITYGKVYRSLKFPPTADSTKMDARYEEGVLHITLGKKNHENKNKKVIPVF